MALVIGLVLLICSVLAVLSTLSLRSELLGQIRDDLTQASARATDRPQGLGSGSTPPSTVDPGSVPGETPGPYQVPGQATGDIDVLFSGSTVVRAGYFDEAGEFRSLVGTEQLATLDALPTDRQIHEVDLGDLGTYLAISTTTPSGDKVVTAKSTAPADDPLRAYVVVEVALIVLAVALAAATGTVLVRRALRPLERVAGTALRVSELPLDRGEVAEIRGVDVHDTDERTEVGTVGAALNRMLGHVESSLAARHESETQVRQFVADASHELRTPLASIRGYAELVRRSPDDVPTDTLRALDRIESEALRMGALVEDLLLLARLDAGRPLEREQVDLVVLAVDALADAHAASPDHAWELDLPGGAEDDGFPDVADAEDADGVVVRGDEARLRQVLVNLLSNARVHTPPGTRVVLGLRTAGEEVVVTVTDDGPGIPSTLLPTLFQRFSRGDAARNRVGGSTGLGMAIAQAIVQEHGGSVTVRSPASPQTSTGSEGPAGRDPRAGSGPGTTFEVTLPSAPAGDAHRETRA
ncbi:signal transduction histidine kinase [Sanguibacter keddieii DSM 10542]|uniref:histidine kinase n=1 Tax=Sanguibacter keddieii (strain ATCC 51767 / DSM 10542 / NCFB 3025 / ST-74) TaxID=446469 RepID=D1BDU5_SANKS|nr:signal transduction histidine kinase [Sanguibacter keddieii DSM 10542]